MHGLRVCGCVYLACCHVVCETMCETQCRTRCCAAHGEAQAPERGFGAHISGADPKRERRRITDAGLRGDDGEVLQRRNDVSPCDAGVRRPYGRTIIDKHKVKPVVSRCRCRLLRYWYSHSHSDKSAHGQTEYCTLRETETVPTPDRGVPWAGDALLHSVQLMMIDHTCHHRTRPAPRP